MALNQEQFNKLANRLSVVQQVSTPKQGLLSGIKEDFSNRVGAGKEAIKSEQSVGSKILQTVGQGAGFVGDVGFQALKAVTPDSVEDIVKSGVETVAQTEPAQKAIASITAWATKHPEAAKNLQAVVDIASLFPAVKAGGKGVDLLETGAKRTAIAAKETAGSLKGTLTDVVTPLESGVETVLNPTRVIPKEKLAQIPMEKIVAQSESKSSKLNTYVKLAEEAVDDFSKPTPLAKAGNKADEALTVINNKLAKQGELKREALGKVGERPVVGVPALRTKLRDELRERVGINLSVTDEGLDVVPATGRASKIAFDPADNKLIKDTYEVLRALGDKPSVIQIDDTVDALQDLLYKRKSAVAVPVNGEVEGVIKSITGQLNRTVKKVAGEQYSKANAKFSYFVDVRDKLNKSLGAEGVRGASLMKQLFSPSGEAPRRLFADVKKLTGIDLVEESTFAKFAMENVGDARQASLLEEVINGRAATPKSFVGMAAERLVGKLQDPIGKARRVIKRPVKK